MLVNETQQETLNETQNILFNFNFYIMAKLSSASIRLVQKMNRQNSSGEFPIYIVICWKGRIEKSTGVSCLPRYWDSKRELIKGGCPNAPVLNKMLLDIKGRCIDRKNEFEYNSMKYTASMLLDDNIVLDLSANGNIYNQIYRMYVEEKGLKGNSIKLYDYTYNVLRKFFRKDDFLINDITLANLKKMINGLGLGDNSIRGICGRIAAVYNYAIQKGIVDASSYPFKEWRYNQRFKKENRNYYLDAVNLYKLKDYFINHCLDIDGELYSYKDGIEDRLMKRSSMEFVCMFFFASFLLNGSSPIDVALLRGDNCSRVSIDGVDYWKVELKRRKTDVPVVCLLERNILTMVCFEHYLGRCGGGYIYPILKDGMTDKQITNAMAKFCGNASIKLKEVCKGINEETIKSNIDNGLEDVLIDIDEVSLYTARHSLANLYLSRPGANIHALATLLGRSPDTISVYVHRLQSDKEIANATKGLLV